MRDQLSHSDHYAGSLLMHSSVNEQPNSIENSYNFLAELKEYSICIVMVKMETFLNIFLIYTAVTNENNQMLLHNSQELKFHWKARS